MKEPLSESTRVRDLERRLTAAKSEIRLLAEKEPSDDWMPANTRYQNDYHKEVMPGQILAAKISTVLLLVLFPLTIGMAVWLDEGWAVFSVFALFLGTGPCWLLMSTHKKGECPKCR